MTHSIYIHIPFCKTKCPYCDFASWANKEHMIDRYFDALLLEVRTKCEAYLNGYLSLRGALATKQSRLVKQSTDRDCFVPLALAMTNKPSINTLFIGGGTPSLIAPEYYEQLFAELKKYFIFAADCEITLELNPGTARSDYLKGYKNLGINRISIGAQSFNPIILETLGRKHSIDETIDAINKIKSAGFENFNLDLIFSVPGMTIDLWTDSVKQALKYNPKHISAYSLIIEPGTPFELIYKDPKLLPSDDNAFDFYSELCRILKENGFIHYEVSNFAKPGFKCKHNLTYWEQKEYYAFGVNAHKFLNGLRTNNLRNLEEYMLNPSRETITEFPINYDFEKVILTSRLNSGLDINLIEKVTTKSPDEVKTALKDLSNEGFIELSGNNLHLTEKGLFLNNEILLKLI